MDAMDALRAKLPTLDDKDYPAYLAEFTALVSTTSACLSLRYGDCTPDAQTTSICRLYTDIQAKVHRLQLSLREDDEGARRFQDFMNTELPDSEWTYGSEYATAMQDAESAFCSLLTWFLPEHYTDPIQYFDVLYKDLACANTESALVYHADHLFRGWYCMLLQASEKPPRKVKRAFLRAFRRYMNKKRRLCSTQSKCWREEVWIGRTDGKFIRISLDDIETYAEQWIMR